jgi:two-component system NtrC family sensor kinase
MDQLIRSEKLAELGKMSTAIGHELNNYLNGISLRVDWAYELLQNENYERTLTLIPEIKHYMNEIARFARGLVEAGQTAPQMKECDLNRTIQKIINFLKPQNSFDDIEFVQKLDPQIPHVWADIGQMEQVFINLFNNAAQAMEKGEISVSTKARSKNRDLKISVKDNGPGIIEDHLSDIFNPYFSTKEGGHGLGLAICYTIIKSHGGTINVNSKPGKWTDFTIHLPTDRK